MKYPNKPGRRTQDSLFRPGPVDADLDNVQAR